MYAIVDIAGQQFKVEKGKKIFVHRLAGETGALVSFDKVLLIGSQEKVNVGAPYISKAVVTAQILSHLRGDKIQVFKKKRRKGYQLQKGHRQDLTELLIEEISETGQGRKTETKKAVESKKEVDAIQEETVSVKDASTEKTAEKKAEEPVAKKELEDGSDVKKEPAKTKKAAAAKTATTAKASAARKPAAKKASSPTDKAKKSAPKATSGQAAGRSKPVSGKTTEKKPADKKK